MLKFSMKPKDDLSMRPDFSYELMAEISRAAKEILDGSDAISGIRAKADVKVFAIGTLTNVSIKVEIARKEGVELSKEEIDKAKEDAIEELKESLGPRMSDIMQEALSSARRRM